MKIIRETTHISGFLYDQPVSDLPALTHCGEALCARGHALKTHAHTGFEFHYLSRGGPFTWQIGRQPLVHRTGEISVTYPREAHRTGPDTYPETQFLWLGLALDDCGEAGRRLARRLRATRCRLISGCWEVEPLLRGLITQVISLRPGRTEGIAAYLQTVIVLLDQQLRADGSAGERSVSLQPYSHAMFKAMSYLEKNLDRRIPLAELAAVAACRGVTNFCTQFRREVGEPPAAYHRRLRLRAARQALRQPAFTVTMAAFQFGFNSSQHFSTCYRQEFGTTPRNHPPRKSDALSSL